FLLPAAGIADPDYWAFRLFAEMLGGGMSSRLFQEAREKLGLAYAIDAWADAWTDAGVLGSTPAAPPATPGAWPSWPRARRWSWLGDRRRRSWPAPRRR
ncbi:MAG TPA: insulinase family protein, partial [Caulobacteraceae bacterium]